MQLHELSNEAHVKISALEKQASWFWKFFTRQAQRILEEDRANDR